MKALILSTLLLVPGLSGCVVGPASIATGRLVYNEVINRTEDEQVLNMIVRDRYDATFGLLAVSNVAASIRARADVSAQWGVSRSLSEDYVGNLVPLAGGVAFEENPTISYIPLGGQQFVQRLLSPLSVEEALLLSQAAKKPREVNFSVLIKSMNGLRNPLAAEDGVGSESFERVAHLWHQLRLAGDIRFGHDPDKNLLASIRTGQAEHAGEVRELLELLRITKPPSGDRLVLPLRLATDARSDEAIYFETRSVLDIVRIAGACIEVPEPHLKAGVVEMIDRAQKGGGFMRIRSSRVPVSGDGTIRVRYRGWWYYVDDSDPESKQSFALLSTLIGIRLHERDKEQTAPVLTIPVK